MYKLKQARDKNNTLFWIIKDQSGPEYYSSFYLKNKAHSSVETARVYGVKLVVFLNYLAENKKRYWQVNKRDIKGFILAKLNFDVGELSSTPSITFNTINAYKTVISDFYRYLSMWSDDVLHIFEKATDQYEEFEVRIDMSFKEVNKIIDATFSLYLSKYKSSEKVYIKEYQPQEIRAIYTQLNSMRNKAIFLLTLHGMRIDEVLSVQQIDYNAIEQTIKPSRSKGRGKGKKRIIVLNNECISVIENYILNERNPTELKVEKDSPYLFVNLKINNIDTELKPVQYYNFYKTFITAANNAGINGARTHTGRAHRAVELLRHVEEGKLGLTDEHWRIIMGWKSNKSAEPYVRHENEKKAIDLSRTLANMKEGFDK